MTLSFTGNIDHGVLQQELIKAIGATGWYLNGSTGQVTFIATDPATPDPTATINAHIANAQTRENTKIVAKIKDEASKIVIDTILHLGPEYQRAFDAANSFKTASYTGTVPPSVQSWADAKIPKQTAQWAADDIIAAGNNWVGAQDQIRANRLKYQEQVKAAATQADVDTAYASWSAFRDTMRSNLGI